LHLDVKGFATYWASPFWVIELLQSNNSDDNDNNNNRIIIIVDFVDAISL